MSNLGAFPLDPESLVGQVRLEIGDVNAEPLDPAVPGSADYDWFGDNEILQFLSGDSSVLRACGKAVRQLALGASLKGISVKTDDLAIDAQKRGSNLLEIAGSYFADADEVDARTKSEIFAVIPFGGFHTHDYAIGL